ncbi:MAG: phosphatase PAP2 family protein [Chitinispirillia bacterium]|nr:phosphatase PAP2 family protein [Chitinispirillia bacterium]
MNLWQVRRVFCIFPVLMASLAICSAAQESKPVRTVAEFRQEPANGLYQRPITNVTPTSGKPGINPYTLIAGAVLAVWAAAGDDFKASSFAARRTPIFGSGERARQTSDALQNASIGIAALIYTLKYLVFSAPEAENVAFAYTATLDFRNSDIVCRDVGCAPNGNLLYTRPGHRVPPDDCTTAVMSPDGTLCPGLDGCGKNGDLPHPTAGIASGVLAFVPLELLKRHTARPRPDGRDTRSYPSGHTTAAAWANGISADMLSAAGLPAQYEIPARTILTLMTVTTAYGRVEGGKHYPGDVFAGALLGSALADASMTLFGEGYKNGGLSIKVTNELMGMTTTLSITVDF